MIKIEEIINLAEWTNKFPVESCIKENKDEIGIYDSEEKFLCFVKDMNFDDRAMLRICYPYIYKKEGEEILYGWADECGNWIDNFERAIHDDDERVFYWKKINE